MSNICLGIQKSAQMQDNAYVNIRLDTQKSAWMRNSTEDSAYVKYTFGHSKICSDAKQH